jgi:hypothetical protein
MIYPKWLMTLAGCSGVILGSIAGQAQTVPASTAIPVVFTQLLKAGELKPGEKITAKTSQAVFLPNGTFLPAGTAVVGHVVESTGFTFDPAPYAVQKPSVLALHFDTIAEGNTSIPVDLYARAIAGPVASHEAEIPHYRDEIDTVGTRILIGGDEFSSLEQSVVSPDGNVVGYDRKDGVFARLLAVTKGDPGSWIQCEATASEQSVGIFSADACGAYGLNTVAMAQNGGDGSGTFVLESRRQTIALNSGSTALLQVLGR